MERDVHTRAALFLICGAVPESVMVAHTEKRLYWISVRRLFLRQECEALCRTLMINICLRFVLLHLLFLLFSSLQSF